MCSTIEIYFAGLNCSLYINWPRNLSQSGWCLADHILHPSKSVVQTPCCNCWLQLPEEAGEERTLANVCPRLSSVCPNSYGCSGQKSPCTSQPSPKDAKCHQPSPAVQGWPENPGMGRQAAGTGHLGREQVLDTSTVCRTQHMTRSESIL